MITIIKGFEKNISFEIVRKNNGEPIISEIPVSKKEIVVREINQDLNLKEDEEIFLDEDTSVVVNKIKKTLDGIIYVYTNFEKVVFDEEEQKIINKMYEKQYNLYANSLLSKNPNIKAILNITCNGRDLSAKEVVTYIEGLKNVQSDFFIE